MCKITKPMSQAQEIDQKRRNRHETRKTEVFDAAKSVANTEWQPYVTAIIRVERTVQTYTPLTGLWKTSHETSFYLSNRMIHADAANSAIRRHWHIENKSHYTRDVTMREDASRIRKNPGVFARLRSFAYNILRFNQADTIAQDRYAAALGGLRSFAKMTFV